MMTKSQRNPKFYLAALVATSAAVLSYKIYETFYKPADNHQKSDEEAEEGEKCDKQQLKPSTITISKKFLNKSIAVTLSSSFLSSTLPLQELLATNEKLIYIIPPNLNEDDVGLSNQGKANTSPSSTTSQYLPPNFKILKCSNMQGYLQILKNLKPDCLLLCSDDLGINNFNGSHVSRDLSNFIKNIINIDQDQDVLTQIKPVFN
ncbi:PEX22 [Candida oxycetoniae]|uniref:Peroxisome assembly protein 22 n=1 Tax=Candida oxycetoniae TaxID=497107 RepID=A0AAI9T0A1_9ASCO|nr:PEX22 [Candida oxycetoniae]KAI3406282.2 PEX22 [Candida oxycetoniae]